VAACREEDKFSSGTTKVRQLQNELGDVHCCKWLVMISVLCT